MKNVFITTYPFGVSSKDPIDALETLTALGYNYHLNDLKRKFTRDELLERLRKINPSVIIAGAEKYDKEALDICTNLKVISRVGVGVSSINIPECDKRNIKILNTPDAPSNAVAELVLAQVLNASRGIFRSNVSGWKKFTGREISNLKIGIIGFGRIGRLIAEKFTLLGSPKIFVNDKFPMISDEFEFEKKEDLIKKSDVIIVQTPGDEEIIGKKEFTLIKSDAIIVNMSRGKSVNEDDLYGWLLNNKDATGIVDVFRKEPYSGPLTSLENAILTPHIASSTLSSRRGMETGAAVNAAEFLRGEND